MKPLKKLNNKITHNKKIIVKYAPFVAIPVVVLSGLYLFTDTLRCRDCVYSDSNIKVRGKDLEDTVTYRQNFYKYKSQTVDTNTLRNDALELLKAEQKISEYAKDKNIKVKKEEVDALYQERIKQNQTEDNLLKLVREMYGFNKSEYLNVLEKDILREKVQKDLGTPLAEWLSNTN